MSKSVELTIVQKELIDLIKNYENKLKTQLFIYNIKKEHMNNVISKGDISEGLYVVQILPNDRLKVLSNKISPITMTSLYNKKVVLKQGSNKFYVNYPNKKIDNSNKIAELKLKLKNREILGLKNIKKARLQLFKWECEDKGLDFNKELEKKEEENRKENIRLEKLKQEAIDLENKSIARAKELNKAETLDMPSDKKYQHTLKNMLVTSPWKRYNLTVYRGVMDENKGKLENTGVAMYGRGLYTTTNRSYAKKYGNLVELTPDDLPIIPLRLKTHTDESLFEQILAESFGIEKRHLHLVGELEEIMLKLGYDGMTIGTGKEMMIVKYFD